MIILILLIVLIIVFLVHVFGMYDTNVDENQPDDPIEPLSYTSSENMFPKIRRNLYLRLVEESDIPRYLGIENDKFVLSPNKFAISLHINDPKYLLPYFRQVKRHDNDVDDLFIDKLNMKSIVFIVLEYDPGQYNFLELAREDKGYVLEKRIHMCGAYDEISVNGDIVGFGLTDTLPNGTSQRRPAAIFRLENDQGEFINIDTNRKLLDKQRNDEELATLQQDGIFVVT